MIYIFNISLAGVMKKLNNEEKENESWLVGCTGKSKIKAPLVESQGHSGSVRV